MRRVDGRVEVGEQAEARVVREHQRDAAVGVGRLEPAPLLGAELAVVELGLDLDVQPPADDPPAEVGGAGRRAAQGPAALHHVRAGGLAVEPQREHAREHEPERVHPGGLAVGPLGQAQLGGDGLEVRQAATSASACGGRERAKGSQGGAAPRSVSESRSKPYPRK